MKKQRIIFICLAMISFIMLSACSAASNVTTTANQSGYKDLTDEIDQLKLTNKDLLKEMDSLNSMINILEQNLYEVTAGSPLLSNYYIDNLLREFYLKNPDNKRHTIDIFPGMLESIKVETIDERILFIFSIDRMEMNPDWNGPGTDAILNKEVKFEEYKGGLDTVFDSAGYDSYEEKQAAVLQTYRNGGQYEFFMIDDEIVFVGPDPGP
jgi:hypothetical protein